MMKPLETLYWLRLALGITAAFICTGYGLATGAIFNTQASFTVFINSLSLALITYLTSYYLIKRKFVQKVEEQRKLVTTGIGVYFISWMVFWILLGTILKASSSG